jgi:hypothetical protein
MPEFGYTAEVRSSQSNKRKYKKKEKFEDPHDIEMKNRVLDKVKLPNGAWDQLRKDLLNGDGKKTICQKYGIKSGYFK